MSFKQQILVLLTGVKLKRYNQQSLKPMNSSNNDEFQWKKEFETAFAQITQKPIQLLDFVENAKLVPILINAVNFVKKYPSALNLILWMTWICLVILNG